MFSEHTYSEDSLLGAPRLCIFLMTPQWLWRLIEKDCGKAIQTC